jgi:fatty-acyl-CoA synthase
VLEAAVVGVPDAQWGEVGRAYLLPRSEQDLPSNAELSNWLKQRLAGYKVPRHFVWVDEFPRTAAGKVQKHLLPPHQGADE